MLPTICGNYTVIRVAKCYVQLAWSLRKKVHRKKLLHCSKIFILNFTNCLMVILNIVKVKF